MLDCMNGLNFIWTGATPFVGEPSCRFSASFRLPYYDEMFEELWVH